MYKIRKLFLFFLVIGIGMLALTSFPKDVHADSSSSIVNYQGVLIKNPNTKYTHKLENQNVNLILNSGLNVFEGKTVNVQVEYIATGGFIVLSLTPVSVTTTPTVSNTTSNTVTFQGTLVKSTNPSYTHVLQGQNLNLILGSQFNYLENSIVKVVVVFNSSNKFSIISVTRV